jgi:hypothetical protein
MRGDVASPPPLAGVMPASKPMQRTRHTGLSPPPRAAGRGRWASAFHGHGLRASSPLARGALASGADPGQAGLT